MIQVALGLFRNIIRFYKESFFVLLVYSVWLLCFKPLTRKPAAPFTSHIPGQDVSDERSYPRPAPAYKHIIFDGVNSRAWSLEKYHEKSEGYINYKYCSSNNHKWLVFITHRKQEEYYGPDSLTHTQKIHTKICPHKI